MGNELLAESEIDLRNQRVLIREDLNVSISDGKITTDQRLVMRLVLRDSLMFVPLTVSHGGATLQIDDILVDTGSTTTLLSIDCVATRGIHPEPATASAEFAASEEWRRFLKANRRDRNRRPAVEFRGTGIRWPGLWGSG